MEIGLTMEIGLYCELRFLKEELYNAYAYVYDCVCGNNRCILVCLCIPLEQVHLFHDSKATSRE
jgi:hypothetical protein